MGQTVWFFRLPFRGKRRGGTVFRQTAAGRFGPCGGFQAARDSWQRQPENGVGLCLRA